VEARGLRIDARERWTPTGLTLKAGSTYELSATGAWSDGGIDCGPSGFFSVGQGCLRACVLRPTERLRVLPAAPWFALIGALDGDPSTAFEIGAGTTYTPARDGMLTCCANDVPWMRWNNRGYVDVTVTPADTPPGAAAR
jgi:hypothetical protein